MNILPAGQSSRAPSRSVECFSCSPPTVRFIETTELHVQSAGLELGALEVQPFYLKTTHKMFFN